MIVLAFPGAHIVQTALALLSAVTVGVYHHLQLHVHRNFPSLTGVLLKISGQVRYKLMCREA